MSKRTKKVPQPRPQDNTLRKLAYLQKLGAIPQVGLTSAIVYHDDWCAHFTGGACKCSPDVQIGPPATNAGKFTVSARFDTLDP